MFCTNCGEKLNDDWVKCPYCGALTENADVVARVDGKENNELNFITKSEEINNEMLGEKGKEEKEPLFGEKNIKNEEKGTVHLEKIVYRKFWKYLLLSVITCGLYGIYVLYGYVRDVNRVCEGDGKESKNYIIVLLLTTLTCGLYGLYWWYTQGERLYNVAPKYGLRIKERGSSILIWIILGCTIMPGLGMLVAIYIMFDNMNRIAMAYNGEIVGEDIHNMEELHPHLIRNIILVYVVLLVIIIGAGKIFLNTLFSSNLYEEVPETIEKVGDYSDKDIEELMGQTEESLKESEISFEKSDMVYEALDGDLVVDCSSEEKVYIVTMKGDGEKTPSFHKVRVGMEINEVEPLLKDTYTEVGTMENKKAYVDFEARLSIVLTLDNNCVEEFFAMQLTEEELQDYMNLEDEMKEDLEEEKEEDLEEKQVKDETKEYIFPDSDKKYLTEEEVFGKDASTLRLARNEIFARHGYIFKSEDLKTYFRKVSWYEERVEADQFNADKVFNDYEKKNVELIKSIEEELTGEAEEQSQADSTNEGDPLEDMYSNYIEVTSDELIRNPSKYDGKNILIGGILCSSGVADYQIIGAGGEILVYVYNGIYDKNGQAVEYVADGDYGYIIGTFYSFGYEYYGDWVHGIDNAVIILNE